VTCRGKARSAFTLVELLLSLVIAVLLVVLLSSMLIATTRTAAGQGERAKGTPAALDAIDTIRDDITRLFLPSDDAGCTLSLKTDPAQLSFCTLQPSETDVDLRWSKTWRVEYKTAPDEAGGIRVLRIASPAIGPGALDGAVTSVVIGAVDRFAVEIYDGVEWHKEWPMDSGPAKPVAARVELSAARFKGKPDWTTEIFIPAGLVVTSTIVRAAR
jgi:type II secretory pathway pseudopilin PulG